MFVLKFSLYFKILKKSNIFWKMFEGDMLIKKQDPILLQIFFA